MHIDRIIDGLLQEDSGEFMRTTARQLAQEAELRPYEYRVMPMLLPGSAEPETVIFLELDLPSHKQKRVVQFLKRFPRLRSEVTDKGLCISVKR
jgi:hypothetical protein